jgi:methylthioribose-1-phosphate isomerase
MKVAGRHYRSIWRQDKDLFIIDQRFLPHRLVVEQLHTAEEAIQAIRDMHVRGAILIGAMAAYGMYLVVHEALETSRGQKQAFEQLVAQGAKRLTQARPTAVNLAWGVEQVLSAIGKADDPEEKLKLSLHAADTIAEDEVHRSQAIADHGMKLIEQISRGKQGQPVNIATHCNAGWLACVDLGTATAPIYAAFDRGINIHVWVSETRPRNQGARLTAWELGVHGVPHTLVVDNAAGHLMQHGMVDLVIVGADRVSREGDVANKIGTYLKALAARDNEVPFYVAFPSSTIDWTMRDGTQKIPIEVRDADEVKFVDGLIAGQEDRVLITPEATEAKNFAFDVTPAALITGLISERGICDASESALFQLYPEQNLAKVGSGA